MKKIRYPIIVLAILCLTLILSGCFPTAPTGTCEFTANVPLTVYRLPDSTSVVFGTMSSGETHTVLAHTAEGWLGFDPGIAQAGNIGLAHHRWVQLNATLSPSCLAGVDQVTLSDVQADVAASGS